jgi:formylglycine-generating enzyme
VNFKFLFLIVLLGIGFSCQNPSSDNQQTVTAPTDRQKHTIDSLFPKIATRPDTTTEGMVWIGGSEYLMGGDNDQASPDEYPKHAVKIKGFWMDATEVTNAQFAQFVAATAYITVAERVPTWEDMKKLLPPDTPRPPDSVFVAGSLVFQKTKNEVNLSDYGQWWAFVKAANWRQPQGSGSSIKGQDKLPVVHIAWEDALAYCKWAGKRLPTEAEWELAARGGQHGKIYPWGNENVDAGKPKTNSWQGKFPYLNLKTDGFEGLAPVKSFAPNGYGVYDMAGNVWEWCFDWYRADYYASFQNQVADNPSGPLSSLDPDEPFTPKRVVRGGSFLCNDGYCSGYRVARRMKSSADTGLDHTGFRCVKN